MCCCGQPTVNGEFGYRWQPNDEPIVRRPNPPDLAEGDTLLYDEPGRCGGLDAHSHHFRVVRGRYASEIALLVRHGGGDERIRVSCGQIMLLPRLAPLSSEDRYWLLHTIYSVHEDAIRQALEQESAKWRKAAAEGRIKTRKVRGENRVKVWIVTPAEVA